MARILDIFRRPKNRSPVPLNSDSAIALLAMTSSAGVSVNTHSALSVAAVYACVKILAESVSSLPCKLYRKTEGGRVESIADPLYQLVKTAPNELQTPLEFFEMMQGLLGLHGNAVAFINRNSFFEPTSLIPLKVDEWTLYKDASGAPVYNVRGKLYPHTDVMHVKAMTLDGITGVSPLTYMAETFGLALAARGHASNFFRNGAQPSGILESPEPLTKEQQDQLRAELDKRQSGVGNTGRPLILGGGMKWTSTSLNARDAQLLESRKFDVEEIARAYRVPLHLLQSTEKSTTWGSGIEQMNIGFIEYTLRPWLVRWEQSLNRSLLNDAQRAQGYYFEFNLDALLRGDFKTRMDGYKIGVEGGFLTVNEVRSRENLPLLPPEIGDVTYRPLNTAPAGATTTDLQ